MTHDEELDAFEAWKGGASQAEIARDMGVSEATMSRVIRKMRRAEGKMAERERTSPRTLAQEPDGEFASVGINQFEGTYHGAADSIERKVFDGLRTQAEEDWREWLGEMRDRAEFERALNRVAEAPAEVPAEVPAEAAEGQLYVLTVDGKNVGLFRDMDRAMSIADRLGGALGLPYDVSPIGLWEGE